MIVIWANHTLEVLVLLPASILPLGVLDCMSPMHALSVPLNSSPIENDPTQGSLTGNNDRSQYAKLASGHCVE